MNNEIFSVKTIIKRAFILHKKFYSAFGLSIGLYNNDSIMWNIYNIRITTFSITQQLQCHLYLSLVTLKSKNYEIIEFTDRKMLYSYLP